jgi:hypothetical protein
MKIRHTGTEQAGKAAPGKGRVRRSLPAALVATVAGASALLTTAPAQAVESCNSTRVCFYGNDGHITNFDPDVEFLPCSVGFGDWWTGFYQIRNRSNRALTVKGQNGAILSRLDPGETIAYTPSAAYTFCIWGL